MSLTDRESRRQEFMPTGGARTKLGKSHAQLQYQWYVNNVLRKRSEKLTHDKACNQKISPGD
jgi:hypothetical protein